ncbi:histidinol dehydrogenase, partial [Candidatus Bathyarchaeota archaeon]|nr:histidinol dehydrogenase [Candidatus Bathyarchaeota archaeon]
MVRIIKLRDFKDENLEKIVNRGFLDLRDVEMDVKHVMEEVRSRGDDALFEFTYRFDGIKLDSNSVKATRSDFEEAYKKVKPIEIRALRRAASSIKRFHEIQLKRLTFQWRRQDLKTGVVTKPISSVGIYAPGGRRPYPSSVLMC